MANGSSTGGGGEYYAEAAVNAEAIHQSMSKAAHSIQAAAQSLSTFSAETLKIKKDFADIGSQVLLNPELLSTSAEFEASALKIVNHYGKTQKHAGVILRLSQQIARLEKETAGHKGKQKTQSAALLINMKKVVKAYKDGEKTQEKQGSAWKKNIDSVKRVAGAVTGLNISFMGVIAMIVDTVNLIRKINAYAKAGAAHLGDGAKAVYQTKSAMFDLRKDFRIAYDEAGKVVNAITAMGFEGEQVARKSPILRNLRKEQAALIDKIAAHERDLRLYMESGEALDDATFNLENMTVETGKYGDKLAKVAASHAKLKTETTKINAANKKAIADASRHVSLAQELYAIERKYGIQVAKTGGIVKTLQQDYGATHMQARNLLGVAIKMGTTLRKEGVPIGIEELLDDWGKLIEKTRVYRTDLLGVLGLYNVMIKKDIAKRLGLEGVSKSVKMDIAKTMTSMALDMEFGWKARIGMRSGLGRSPAEAGIKFEKMLQESPLKGFQAVVKELTFMVGDIKKHPYEAEFRGRELLQKVGFGKESAVVLARAIASGNLTEEKVRKEIIKQTKEQKELKELQKKWEKGRVQLVKTAGEISRGQQQFQDLLKKWIEDNIMQPLLDIYDAIQGLAAWFQGGEVEAKRHYATFGKDFRESMGMGKGPAIAGRTLASQAFRVMEEKGLVPEERLRIKRYKETLEAARRTGEADDVREAMDDLVEVMAKSQTSAVTRLFKAAKQKVGAKSGEFQRLQRMVDEGLYAKAAEFAVDIMGREWAAKQRAGYKHPRGRVATPGLGRR